jgi:hypothetical protein
MSVRKPPCGHEGDLVVSRPTNLRPTFLVLRYSIYILKECGSGALHVTLRAKRDLL